MSLLEVSTSYSHASNAVGTGRVAPREPPLAVILVEEIAEEAHIGSSNKAKEGEDKGMDRDHYVYYSVLGGLLVLRSVGGGRRDWDTGVLA
jgi:hypothetical protein